MATRCQGIVPLSSQSCETLLVGEEVVAFDETGQLLSSRRDHLIRTVLGLSHEKLARRNIRQTAIPEKALILVIQVQIVTPPVNSTWTLLHNGGLIPLCRALQIAIRPPFIPIPHFHCL